VLAIHERLAAAEPANTTYARGLSISYTKLGDLALATGQSREVERLYRRALAIDERLAAAEPDNTTYARDLAVSYERLADLALETGQYGEAERLLREAVGIRRRVHSQEATRVDLAEELAVSLYLLATIPANEERTALKGEIGAVLEPFDRAGAITEKGVPLLRWARADE